MGSRLIVETNLRIRPLAQKGEWALAWRVLENAGTARDRVSYNTVLAGCEKAKEWQGTLRLIDVMATRRVDPCTISYATTLSALSKAGKWERSLRLLRHTTDARIALNAIAYNSVLHGMSLAGRWQQALDLFDLMQDAPSKERSSSSSSTCTSSSSSGGDGDGGLAPSGGCSSSGGAANSSIRQDGRRNDEAVVVRTVSTYHTVISALARASRWQRALDIFRQIPEPTVYSYATILNAMEKSKQSDWALALYPAMMQLAESADAAQVTIATNAVLSALEKTKQWQKALALLEETAWSSFTPSVYSYNAVLSALDKGKQWSLALDLLQKMKTQHIPPDTISYNATISALRGHPHRILRLVQHMRAEQIEPTVITFTAALQGMKENEQQVEVLSRMRDAGVAPNVLTYLMVSKNPLIDVSTWDLTTLVDWQHPDATYHCAALVGDLTDNGKHVPSKLRDEYATKVFTPLLARLRSGASDVEKVTNLGAMKTRDALAELEVPWPSDMHFPRAATHLGEFQKKLLAAFNVRAYVEYDLHLPPAHGNSTAKDDTAPRVVSLLIGSEVFTYTKEKASGGQPVLGRSFAHHSRNTHAERVALESLARRIDRESRGSITLVATHALCVGCLAAVAQFRRLFPHVKLSVGFPLHRQKT
eukprot:GEMP01029709.1.p1 GENE.GEMP01029709.1~~GEMP01029709.1.p1  ORF type:complete len:649 (+),score=190.17 GEMP01029709.1:133-2079(+)